MAYNLRSCGERGDLSLKTLWVKPKLEWVFVWVSKRCCVVHFMGYGEKIDP